MNDDFEMLAEQIAHRRVIVVAGAGVARQITGNAPTWPELLSSGARFAAGLMAGNAEEWRQTIERLVQLGVGDPRHGGSLLLAAEGIQREIRQPSGGEGPYREWLNGCFAGLRPQDSEVGQLLSELSPSMIATTNYDDLLEQVVEWKGYSLGTADDLRPIQSVVRGERTAVVHLHGRYQVPSSVVLGIRDYDDILADAFAGALLRSLLLTRTLLFVGFGAGLGDPNFESLLGWSESVLRDSDVANYCLVRQGENPAADDRSMGRLRFLTYGKEHAQLKPFLVELRNAAKVRQPRRALTVTGGETVRAGDEIFVPDFDVSRELSEAIRRGVSLIVLEGTLGSGRSLVARWLAYVCQNAEDEAFPGFDDVLWLPARAMWWNLVPHTARDIGNHNVLDYLALWAERLDHKSEASLSRPEFLLRSYEYLSNRRYLVVLEGLEHVSADGCLPDELQNFLRFISGQSCVVVTSEKAPQFADFSPESHPDQFAVILVGERSTTQVRGYLKQYRLSHADATGERAKAIESLVAQTGSPLPLVVVQWACGCPQDTDKVLRSLKGARKPLELGTQKSLFRRLVLDRLLEREREVLFTLALFAPPPTAVAPSVDDLARVTGGSTAEVRQALETLQGRLLIWQHQQTGYAMHALTAKCVLSARTPRLPRERELESAFVRWAVALAREHNEWEMNSILTRSLMRHLDNLRVAYLLTTRSSRRPLVTKHDLYVLGRTIGQALYVDGRWELGKVILDTLQDRLPARSAVQLMVRLLVARHQALQNEAETLKAAEALCLGVLRDVDRWSPRTTGARAEKREIRAEALMRLADVRSRQPDVTPQELAAARQDLESAIEQGKFGIRINARNVLAAIWLRMGEEPRLAKPLAAKACFGYAREVLRGERVRVERSAWNRIKAQAARLRADACLGLGLRTEARAAYEDARANSRHVVDERLNGWLKLIEARLAGNPGLAREAAEVFRRLRMQREELRARRIAEEIDRRAPPPAATERRARAGARARH